ncbi:ATP-grasp domain-containing protein [Lutibacter sp.]|uniref:ATP-grasp domain-containing protein n=1 Tax=Lutibacter sp. TaxID=1925666 RepID=UPI001A1F15D0|nr:ATP-grasp domain-containing protein [Lutibacter sp.]MBI9040968.1 ATP-grasp domain-containing protein [Lutibacter sp.]
MILIDQPFASDFLVKTIKENQFPIIATEVAKSMISDESLNWISEEKAIQQYTQNDKTRIYSNSENAINWIEKHLKNTELPQKIQLFKNKITFRELIKDAFPEYFFKGIPLEKLKYFPVSELKFPLIIKPAVGFFSLAVHKIDNIEEWLAIINTIETEVETFKDMYPKEVVDVSDFIIEEYIEGEEYAVDCYFDNQGKVVVLNILHHIFSSSKDVSDRVYTTSKEILNRYLSIIETFLQIVGNKAQLKNFPMHVEVRIDSQGKITPIEINPLRFGGWCTTGDISWFAFGINSYEYFLNGKTPNWNEIFKNNANKLYSLIVLDNNSGIDGNTIKSFNYNLLLKDFEKPLEIRKVNYKKYGVFGFLFTETSVGNEQELNTILTSKLTNYIEK